MASGSAPASLLLLVAVFLLSGPLGARDPWRSRCGDRWQVAVIASDLTDYTPGDTVT
jgi:hypothetical protein